PRDVVAADRDAGRAGQSSKLVPGRAQLPEQADRPAGLPHRDGGGGFVGPMEGVERRLPVRRVQTRVGGPALGRAWKGWADRVDEIEGVGVGLWVGTVGGPAFVGLAIHVAPAPAATLLDPALVGREDGRVGRVRRLLAALEIDDHVAAFLPAS